jgi:dihydroorotase
VRGNVDKGAPQHSGSTAYINARIIDPAGDAEYRGAVLISDGKIADYGPNLFASGAPYGIQSIDCRGFYLAPGLVDTRVHTGEPGEEHKETLASAGAAAAVGGITSLVLLPDNEPPFDDASLIEFVARRARQVKLANMYAYGALTNGLARSSCCRRSIGWHCSRVGRVRWGTYRRGGCIQLRLALLHAVFVNPPAAQSRSDYDQQN